MTATRVLVVDDSPSVARLVTETLVPEGFEVLIASDGPNGLMKVRANPGLDLVILDFNMPGMNGLSVLQWLNSEGVTNKTSVVMMTTEAAPTLVQRAKQLGAKAWLVKPLQPERLLSLVKSLVALRSNV